MKLGEGETAGSRELAARVREARRSGRIREDRAVAFLCPQEETLRAVLTESRREPLEKNVWIFGDFSCPARSSREALRSRMRQLRPAARVWAS